MPRAYFVWAAALAVALPSVAVACSLMPYDMIANTLRSKHHEPPHSAGITGEPNAEIWTGANGSWSMVVRMANGLGCVAATGHAWGPVKREPLGEDG